MLREWGRDIRILLEEFGIDAIYMSTIVVLIVAVLFYGDIKRWKKLNWDRKLWIVSLFYALTILLVISLLRLVGVLDL